MDEFAGFDGDALDALRALPGWTKEDRAANKAAYDHLVETTKAFTEAVGERVRQGVSETVTVEPKINGSISPFNRDLRFAEDRSLPYKDCLMVNLWDGPEKKTAPTLRVRMTPDHTGFAAGAMFTEEGLERWRAAVAGPRGEELADALAGLAERHPGLDIPEPELKRVPGDHDSDHPRADLLRHKSLQVRWQDPTPPTVDEPAFVDWCGERFDELGPVHNWLVAEL